MHAAFPGKFLAYNLSPSFNWDAAGMTDEQIERYTCDLGRRGFVWQVAAEMSLPPTHAPRDHHARALACCPPPSRRTVGAATASRSRIHCVVRAVCRCSSRPLTAPLSCGSQFITLAGLHTNGLAIHQFAHGYAARGMGAYNAMIQREERMHGVKLIKHQHWSGAELMDRQMAVATGGGLSTSAMGSGVTEAQFEADKASA